MAQSITALKAEELDALFDQVDPQARSILYFRDASDLAQLSSSLSQLILPDADTIDPTSSQYCNELKSMYASINEPDTSKKVSFESFTHLLFSLQTSIVNLYTFHDHFHSRLETEYFEFMLVHGATQQDLMIELIQLIILHIHAYRQIYPDIQPGQYEAYFAAYQHLMNRVPYSVPGTEADLVNGNALHDFFNYVFYAKKQQLPQHYPLEYMYNHNHNITQHPIESTDPILRYNFYRTYYRELVVDDKKTFKQLDIREFMNEEEKQELIQSNENAKHLSITNLPPFLNNEEMLEYIEPLAPADTDFKQSFIQVPVEPHRQLAIMLEVLLDSCLMTFAIQIESSRVEQHLKTYSVLLPMLFMPCLSTASMDIILTILALLNSLQPQEDNEGEENMRHLTPLLFEKYIRQFPKLLSTLFFSRINAPIQPNCPDLSLQTFAAIDLGGSLSNEINTYIRNTVQNPYIRFNNGDEYELFLTMFFLSTYTLLWPYWLRQRAIDLPHQFHLHYLFPSSTVHGFSSIQSKLLKRTQISSLTPPSSCKFGNGLPVDINQSERDINKDYQPIDFFLTPFLVMNEPGTSYTSLTVLDGFRTYLSSSCASHRQYESFASLFMPFLYLVTSLAEAVPTSEEALEFEDLFSDNVGVILSELGHSSPHFNHTGFDLLLLERLIVNRFRKSSPHSSLYHRIIPNPASPTTETIYMPLVDSTYTTFISQYVGEIASQDPVYPGESNYSKIIHYILLGQYASKQLDVRYRKAVNSVALEWNASNRGHHEEVQIINDEEDMDFGRDPNPFGFRDEIQDLNTNPQGIVQLSSNDDANNDDTNAIQNRIVQSPIYKKLQQTKEVSIDPLILQLYATKFSMLAPLKHQQQDLIDYLTGSYSHVYNQRFQRMPYQPERICDSSDQTLEAILIGMAASVPGFDNLWVTNAVMQVTEFEHIQLHPYNHYLQQIGTPNNSIFISARSNLLIYNLLHENYGYNMFLILSQFDLSNYSYDVLQWVLSILHILQAYIIFPSTLINWRLSGDAAMKQIQHHSYPLPESLSTIINKNLKEIEPSKPENDENTTSLVEEEQVVPKYIPHCYTNRDTSTMQFVSELTSRLDGTTLVEEKKATTKTSSLYTKQFPQLLHVPLYALYIETLSYIIMGFSSTGFETARANQHRSLQHRPFPRHVKEIVQSLVFSNSGSLRKVFLAMKEKDKQSKQPAFKMVKGPKGTIKVPIKKEEDCDVSYQYNATRLHADQAVLRSQLTTTQQNQSTTTSPPTPSKSTKTASSSSSSTAIPLTLEVTSSMVQHSIELFIDLLLHEETYKVICQLNFNAKTTMPEYVPLETTQTYSPSYMDMVGVNANPFSPFSSKVQPQQRTFIDPIENTTIQGNQNHSYFASILVPSRPRHLGFFDSLPQEQYNTTMTAFKFNNIADVPGHEPTINCGDNPSSIIPIDQTNLSYVPVLGHPRFKLEGYERYSFHSEDEYRIDPTFPAKTIQKCLDQYYDGSKDENVLQSLIPTQFEPIFKQYPTLDFRHHYTKDPLLSPNTPTPPPSSISVTDLGQLFSISKSMFTTQKVQEELPNRFQIISNPGDYEFELFDLEDGQFKSSRAQEYSYSEHDEDYDEDDDEAW